MVFVSYLLFFFSGAAGLIYQVAWTRAFGLIFGGSHLAVTTVLAVFMGGLALGGLLWGRRADKSEHPLRLYALLELGVALFAAVFFALMELYPSVYVALARLAEGNRLYLTALRVGFAALAMIVPTTLMGGTLPALSRFMADRPDGLRRHLPFLYGLNTLGAIAGVLAAGFVLLEWLGAKATVGVAIGLNVAVGGVALFLPHTRVVSPPSIPPARLEPEASWVPTSSRQWVLWGAGISGFCALGYEVLWTRVLSMVVGTTVYGVALILSAVLSGIALGSWAVGLWKGRVAGGRMVLVAFAWAQLLAGLFALVATVLMGALPEVVGRLQALLFAGASNARLGYLLRFAVAFAYVFLPAFFLGAAFPLAGLVHQERKGLAGKSVGEVLTVNTVGAILGTAVTGFLLVYLWGAERSLLFLVALNLGVGACVLASFHGRAASMLAAAGSLVLAFGLALGVERGALWSAKRFATYVNNQPEIFESREARERGLERFEVLYYFEGANETISVVRSREGHQAFIVNGRSEATTAPGDVQCQRTLGHLPMLLHPNPRKVFVLGAGSGMTLGAITLHKEVESIVLAEIEPGALGATRSFGEFNHKAMDDPRLQVVFNDGRNYLFTTPERFDVITADPIHPWCGGASYLYTQEYFDSVAARLKPGGVASQWLPIYELSPRDLATVVRTFSAAFPHVMIWLTHYDAELVGSREPLVLDEQALARRMEHGKIAEDLASVGMGSPQAFLSYFLAGNSGAKAFAQQGVINTDDNLFLEFSAPKSMGRSELLASNVAQLMRHRESVGLYLAKAGDEDEAAVEARWSSLGTARAHCDRAQLQALAGRIEGAEFRSALELCEAASPGNGPAAFLRSLVQEQALPVPELVSQASFELDGRTVTLSVVAVRLSQEKADVHVVDNAVREIYGTALLTKPATELEAGIQEFSGRVLAQLKAAHARSASAGKPAAGPTLEVFRAVVQEAAKASSNVAAR